MGWPSNDARFPREEFMVEGKGFVEPEPPTSRNLTTTPLQEEAPSGTPRPPASTPEDDTPPPPGSSDAKEGSHGDR